MRSIYTILSLFLVSGFDLVKCCQETVERTDLEYWFNASSRQISRPKNSYFLFGAFELVYEKLRPVSQRYLISFRFFFSFGLRRLFD